MLASVLQLEVEMLMKTCVASPERARMGSFLVAVERQLTPAPPRPGNEN